MGPGVDPHLYKPTAGDLNALQRADVIIANGLHLEGKLAEALSSFAKQKYVISIGDSLPPSQLRAAASGNSHDPHIWFDVQLWKQALQVAEAALCERYPQHAPALKANARTYYAKLDSAEQQMVALLGAIPRQNRVLITAHDAFGYFGQAYGLEVRGLQGISTVAEFGLKDIGQLVDYLVDRRIPAVFVESSVPERAIRAVMDGCQQRGHNVRLGGTLYSDALGAADSPAGTYTGMLLANARTISQALSLEQ